MVHSVSRIKVAAIQMTSENGRIDANLARATTFVDQAAQLGAKLILLPELMPPGYVLSKQIWDGGEPRNGKTTQWLRGQAKRLGAYIGTSFLEADGEDFFNTFVLAGPDGRDAGRVRKQTPALVEAYFTKGDAGPHTIETKIGTIGVGICYENWLAYLPELMYSQSVDLMLMPHSAPMMEQGILFPRKTAEFYAHLLQNIPVQYANMLGIPVVLTNKSGPFISSVPGFPWMHVNARFPGSSAIIDSDGTAKARLEGEEAVIVEEVVLDPARKAKTAPQCCGRWAVTLPWTGASLVFNETMNRLTEAGGRTWYSWSRARRRRAKEIGRAASVTRE